MIANFLQLSCLQGWLLCYIFSSGVILVQAQEINPTYIFETDYIDKKLHDQKSILDRMAMYYEGVEKAEISMLESVFHNTWVMRDSDTPNEQTLNVENKTTFLKRVRDHGPYPGYAEDRVFANIGMANEHLAFVRINKASSRSSTYFFLFKVEDEWVIMDKIWANTNTSAERYHSSTNSTAEKTIKKYYDALEEGNRNELDHILHDDWDLKAIDQHQILQMTSKSELISNHDHFPPSADYGNLISMDVYYNKLCIARLDLPAHHTTVFLTLFKIGPDWKIVCERRSSITS